MSESKFVKANEKIAGAVTGGCKKVEETVVGAYKKVEDAFVGKFLVHEGETVGDAKKRLAANRPPAKKQAGKPPKSAPPSVGPALKPAVSRPGRASRQAGMPENTEKHGYISPTRTAVKPCGSKNLLKIFQKPENLNKTLTFLCYDRKNIGGAFYVQNIGRRRR